MSQLSNWAEDALRTLIFRSGTGLTKSTNIYVGLCTTMPTDLTTGSTAVEPVGNGYARVQINPHDDNWSADSATDGVTKNKIELTWTASGGAWSEVVGFIVATAATNGNVICYGALNAPKTLADGETLRIPPNAITITIG